MNKNDVVMKSNDERLAVQNHMACFCYILNTSGFPENEKMGCVCPHVVECNIFFINKADEGKDYFRNIIGGHQPILHGVMNFEETKLVYML